MLAPSVLALAVWSSAFTAVAIATGFERRYGVLERLAATPLGRSGLIAGKAGAVLLILVGQLAVLVAVALALGWRPAFTAASALAAVALVVLAAAAFVSLALLLAGRLRAEVTLAVANLVYVLLLVGGALVVPLDRYPTALQPVLALLPTAALGEGLRAAADRPGAAAGPGRAARLAARRGGADPEVVPMDLTRVSAAHGPCPAGRSPRWWPTSASW